MTAPVHAATVDELSKLRSSNQWGKFRLAVVNPPVVFAAQVNQTFTKTDEVKTVTYDTVTTGAYTNLVAGMTLLVGSSAGARDMGTARIKSATATQITIGRTSDVPWADNLYITALDEFGLWAKQPTLTADGVRIDDGIKYTDQHRYMAPVPVMGPDRCYTPAQGALIGGTGPGLEYTANFDGSSSWCPDGSTITTYAWSATGAYSSANVSTATPTFVFRTSGYHRITLTVTASNGRSATGHRVVWVAGSDLPALEQLTVERISGEADSGGWSAAMTVYAGAGLTEIRDRAKVFLVAEDWYNGARASIGQVAGQEHVVFVGWIDGESIAYDKDLQTVTFSARGPAHWIDRLGSMATFMEGITTTPSVWTQIQSLTIDKAVWHWLYWRSTAVETLDFYPSTWSVTFGGMTASMGSVWSQIKDLVESRALGYLRADRYGRIFAGIDPQALNSNDRAAIPVVQAISDDDLGGQVEITRRILPEVSILNLSGLATSGSTTSMVLSRATGKALKQFGRPETRDRLILSSQTHGNQLAGLLLAKANNEFPQVNLELAQINRLIDIAPAQYVTLSISPTSNARGISWTAKKLIVKRVEIAPSGETGAVVTAIEGETETYGLPGVTVDMPTEVIYNFPEQPAIPGADGYATYPLTPINVPNTPDNLPPQIPEDPTSTCPDAAPANGPYNLCIYGVRASGSNPSSALTCILRSSSHANISRYVINAVFQKKNFTTGEWEDTTDDGFYDLKAYDLNGTLLTTGTHDTVTDPNTRSGYFSLPANVTACYFVLEIGGMSALFPPASVNAVTNQITNGYIIDPGTQEWWTNGQRFGFHWKGLTIIDKSHTVQMSTFLYPPSGVIYTSQYLHIKGWTIYTPVDALLANPKWVNWIGATNWNRLSLTYDIDMDFQERPIDNVIGITHEIDETHGYFGAQGTWTAEMFYELWPQPPYRLLISSVLLYNICPPTGGA